MKFHEEWRHDDCSVMKWYRDLYGKDTKFRSVEHWENLEGPFFHQFLLLRLADGAACRVERIGEGSRADAIRYIGCKSHDIIQWRPGFELSKLTHGARRIAELDMGQYFDLIDVLSICFAIQKTKPCDAYTLQRYNCYFLCLTILAILTRRVASWETQITREKWELSMSATLDKFANLSFEEANRHTILKLCCMLGAEGQQPWIPIIDALRKGFTANSECFSKYKKSISSTLWAACWEESLTAGLGDQFLSVVNAIKDEANPSTEWIKDVGEMRMHDAALTLLQGTDITPRVIRAIQETYARGLSIALARHDARMRMKKIEEPVSFRHKFFSGLIGFGGSFCLKSIPGFIIHRIRSIGPIGK
ncbi:hypothetical protein RhiJN_14839 [Ceratobasidium sp. AG-Ba]|nr:hypothetical protein RhiJN_14839 [Ceratobasidium sp. AG-Ba]